LRGYLAIVQFVRLSQEPAMRARHLFFGLGACVIMALKAMPADEQKGPLSPEESQQCFKLAPGLRIELVAAEPDVQSPVAMTFDEDGRLFVVEMLDYPNGPPKGQPPEGRIRLLVRDKTTGRYKANSIYADKLLFANGVMPWNSGVIVTAAPNILFLKDTKSTGKADLIEKLYEGFATENPQLRVSHPNLGIDNWIYVSNGLRGGQVKRSGKDEAKPINISGRDFRFDLIHDHAEATTGMGQYGNTFDEWGNRFVCSNRNHWVHMVLPEQYIRRNPYLAVPPPHKDNQGPGGAARVYPISQQITTAAEHAGSFTAACGVYVYKDDLLPKEYQGSIFTCEPTGNLVHQEILLPKGSTFTGRPARQGVEFLASTDQWFRPVFLTSGPDGALYVVDMYRKVIEHPEWLPKEQKNRTDLLAGKDRGRIWRIVPGNGIGQRAEMAKLPRDLAGLCNVLDKGSEWKQSTVQRMLLTGQWPPEIDQSLRRIVTNSNSPLARVRAAWLLAHRKALHEDLVLKLLHDEHARVREQGVRLSEPFLATSEIIQRRIIELAGDADAHLSFQVALSLGEWGDDRILKPLAKIAVANSDDSWSRLAVASSVPSRAGALLATLFQPESGLTDQLTTDRLQLVQLLASVVGGRHDPSEVASTLETALKLTGKDAASWQMAVRKGLAEGMSRRGVQLAAFAEKLPEDRRDLLIKMNALMEKWIALAREGSGNSPERIEAVGMLAQTDWKTAGPLLDKLLGEESAAEVRLAAVRAMAAFPNPEVAGMILKSWPTFPVPLQRAAAETLLQQPERTLVFLAELESGRIKTDDLDSLRRLQLVNHRRSDIRDRAKKLLANVATPDRRKVIDDYKAALKLNGDARRGREVFQAATCASCHKLGNLGTDVGPDISDARARTPEQLLVDVLDPNAAIDANYINYVVTLKNGKVLTGLLASETASSITLTRADRQSDVVLRQDIDPDGIVSTGKSLMPEGLEKNMSPQQFADLLEFLRRWHQIE
jgi:putative membrane-bound dehydrogenase-like protein